MAVVIGTGGVPIDTFGSFNLAILLHGAQKIKFFDEISREGEIETTGPIGVIWDKGKGASVDLVCESIDLATGQPLRAHSASSSRVDGE